MTTKLLSFLIYFYIISSQHIPVHLTREYGQQPFVIQQDISLSTYCDLIKELYYQAEWLIESRQ